MRKISAVLGKCFSLSVTCPIAFFATNLQEKRKKQDIKGMESVVACPQIHIGKRRKESLFSIPHEYKDSFFRVIEEKNGSAFPA